MSSVLKVAPLRVVISLLAIIVGAVIAVALTVGLSQVAVAGPQRALPVKPFISITLVISQFQVAGDTAADEFVELHNISASPVDLNGHTLAYRSAAGVTDVQLFAWTVTTMIPPGGYYLIGANPGYNGTPAADVTYGDGGFGRFSGTSGGLGLRNGPYDTGPIVDSVGYGTATNAFVETTPIAVPPANDSRVRKLVGCQDTDNNASDFDPQSPSAPRNSGSPANLCGGPTATPTYTNTPGGPTATNTAIPPTATSTSTPVLIRQIQSVQHISPFSGLPVSNVPGIVTALRTNGFYMQDPTNDANESTSEAIFVFTSSAPGRALGDSVLVSGTVSEFRPGGSGSTNLTTTQIGSPVVSLQSTGNPLPAAIVIGAGGRVPPNMIIDNDSTGNVEVGSVFDPAQDGIDFYESLESMLVQVNNPVAVGPRTRFGEIAVLADDGAGGGVRTTRGGIIIQPTDFNPERIILDDVITTTASVNVGDHFSGPAVGILDYSFGNFKLLITQPLTAVSSGLTQEVTAVQGANQIAIGNFNVENLDPFDPPAQFTALAGLIVNNMRLPDIISIEEIQDNDGPTNSTIVDATTTWNMLIAEIQAQSGITYQFRNVNPVDDQDGGEPGGNIRQGFLFRTDRGVAFVDRAGGCSTCPNSVVATAGGPELLFSPGRIDPTNTAFNTSRKPLAGEFTYNGNRLFVIGNHFNSKGGDHPLFGRFQPPVRSSEVQRNQQAQIVNDFVDSILAQNSNANVVVLGDINDFYFSSALITLKGGVLNDLLESLPLPERYTYVFDGNSQDLDHTLISNNLFNNTAFQFDVVHVNSEFAVQASDHEGQVARFTLNPACTLNTNYLVTSSTGATPVPATNYVPGSTCNACTVGLTLPFTYFVYDTPYTTLNASNKGNLQFTTNNSTGANTCLPAPALGDAILPYWDDLNTNINDVMGIYTSTTGVAPNRIFNIEWKAGFEANDVRPNFQVRLYEGKPKYEVIYGQTRNGFSATVGVQNADGTRFTQYECNTNGTIQPGLRLIFDRYQCPVQNTGKK